MAYTTLFAGRAVSVSMDAARTQCNGHAGQAEQNDLHPEHRRELFALSSRAQHSDAEEPVKEPDVNVFIFRILRPP